MATWNLWHTLETVRRELDRVFDDSGPHAAPAFRTAFLPGRAARQYPLTNFYEDKDAVYLEALAPDVDAATLELSVVGNILSISGEQRRIAGEVHSEAFHRSERPTGQFVRQLHLSMEVDE
jgi:HSP20 family protein